LTIRMRTLLCACTLLLLTALATVSIAKADANLVTNGGFETVGDYIGTGLYQATGWTIIDSSSATGIYSTLLSPGTGYPGTLGLYQAEGSSFLWGGGYHGQTGTIATQHLATSNQTYYLDFSLANTNNNLAVHNSWFVSWNVSTLFSETGVSDFGYKSYHAIVSGTGHDTLQFGFNNEPGAFALDKVSVSAVPIPSAAWLLGSALLGLVGFRRKK